MKVFSLQIAFEKKNGLSSDRSIADFVDENEAEVESNRLRIWGKTSHPKNRWTTNNLENDVKEIDKLNSVEIAKFLGSNLEYHYVSAYRRSNWDIHSGSTAFFGYKPQKFSLNNFSYFWDSSNFGILCTKLVLMEFQFHKVVPDFENEFEKLQIKQNSFLP